MQKKFLVDTNILVHLLSDDRSPKHFACKELFEKAKKSQLNLYITSIVVIELSFVLHQKGYSWETIKSLIHRLCNSSGVKVLSQKAIKLALQHTTRTDDFVDEFLVAQAQELALDGAFSYDKKFGKNAGLKRLQP